MPSAVGPSSSLNEILVLARHESASDVHLGALRPIIFRQFGQLKNRSTENLSAQQIQQLITAALPPEMIEHFEKNGDVEYVHTISGFGRFRIAMMKQREGWDLTARLVPLQIQNSKKQV